MANTVQIKRGSNTSVNAHTGPSGEIIYNLDTGRLHAQDGSTAGGKPHALISDVDLKANADVNIIAGTGLTGGGTLAASRTLALNSTSIASLAKADTAVQSVNGKSGAAVALVKGDVGLGNVDNTSDLAKPISTLTQTALNAKANSSVTVSAGSGLTGGGTLTANRTVALNAASIASLAKADSALQAPGGSAGQILAKSSNTTNDVAWVSSEAATAVSYAPQTLTPAQQVQARQNIQADHSYDTIAIATAATVPAFANAIRTNGYYAAGDGGGALYKRVASEPSHAGKVQSADGAWWELVTDVANVKMFGAKGDGVSDDGASILDACSYAKSKKVSVYYPSGVYITSSTIPIWSGCIHYGDGGQYGVAYQCSIIKLANSANIDVFRGETTNANWDVEWADWHDIGDNFWYLRDIVIDGNRENNTIGNGLVVWGRRFTIGNVTIRHTGSNGIVTKFSDGSTPSGMESYLNNIVIDSTGQHGWDFMGPHDSVVNCLNIIDAGLSEHNVYSGLNVTTGGNARFFAFHAWSRGNNTVRMRHALSMASSAGVCDFSNSHFEGAYQANILLDGGKFIGSDTCMYYAAWNGLNILVNTGGHIIKGVLGGPGAGRPASKGIVMGYDPSQNIWGCRIDVFAESQGAGIIDFARSSGGNMIDIIGYNDTGVFTVGTPNAGDTCRIKVSGGGGGRLFQDAT